MGDFMQNFEFFKKIGFDKPNAWFFYDEKFQNFFDFFTKHIKDENILSEHEVLECDELERKYEYLDSEDSQKRLQVLDGDYSGFLLCEESDVVSLTQEIQSVEQSVEEYNALLDDMRVTKNTIHCGLSELEDRISGFINVEHDLLSSCSAKAKQLELMQMSNMKLSTESTSNFMKMHSPPLFMHQLPLDQYFLKCDSFMQYFTLYMKENFKIQDYIDLESCNNVDTPEITYKLNKLAKTMEHYTLQFVRERAKVKATKSLIENLDLTQIYAIGLPDMERETRDLELVHEHHLKSAQETLLNDLSVYAAKLVQQKIELILYENTKQKLERALRRQENDRRLTKIISDALSNAELVWMTIQLDLEKKRNRFDNTEQMTANAQAAMRRIRAMKNVQNSPGKAATCSMLIEKMADELSQHLGQSVRAEPKDCLYEYAKFLRLLNYGLHGMLNKNAYTLAMDTINELNNIEHVLKPLVYNGPVQAPMFEHVRFLRPIFQAKIKHDHINTQVRNMRTQFKDNIIDRMEKDKLWRYGQLLWIWFLTEPKRVLIAIEDVKKIASKLPAIKSLGGIKRK